MDDKKMSRQGIDIFTKKQILEEVEKGTSYRKIKERFNLKHSSNICQIIKNKDKVLSRFESLDSPFRKTLKTTKYENIDNGLKQFIANCEQNGLPVRTENLREKALQIARESGQLEFRASNGYLSNFSNRKNAGPRASSVCSYNSEETENKNLGILNLGLKFQDLISNYDPKDIFSAEEFGLFWRLFPNKKINDRTCKFGQESDERLTIFTAASMIGEKLPLTIISNDQRPENIKEISKLNVSYYSDLNSWINPDIFNEIILMLNEQMKQENRSILMFIESSSAHNYNITLSNLKLVYLPVGSCQPLKLGVFKCLKAYYRMKLCRKLYALGESNDPKVKLFNVIEMLSYSWDNEIKSVVVVDCFKQCGFYQAKGINDEEIVSENEIQNEFETICSNFNRLFSDVGFKEYVEIDSSLATCELLEEGSNISMEEDESLNQSQKQDSEKIEAINAIDTLKLYFAKNFTDDLKDILGTLNDLENKIYEHNLAQKS